MTTNAPGNLFFSMDAEYLIDAVQLDSECRDKARTVEALCKNLVTQGHSLDGFTVSGWYHHRPNGPESRATRTVEVHCYNDAEEREVTVTVYQTRWVRVTARGTKIQTKRIPGTANVR